MNGSPSLSDLMALWLSESHPELHALDNMVVDNCGWIFGYINDTSFYHMIDREMMQYQAADPEFFAKVDAGLVKVRSSKTRLYKAAFMPETPPTFSIAE